ncbi:MAG: electron transfer flavoprotein subunit alpha, partial [Chloroflexi bacterium]|nr:electron transfer flavoprotein subunit alpha [Chloroflexota bacterium]
MKGSAGIMIFAEPRADGIHPVSYELLGKGRELAERLGVPLSSVLLGSHAEEQARELIYHGGDRVYCY